MKLVIATDYLYSAVRQSIVVVQCSFCRFMQSNHRPTRVELSLSQVTMFRSMSDMQAAGVCYYQTPAENLQRKSPVLIAINKAARSLSINIIVIIGLMVIEHLLSAGQRFRKAPYILKTKVCAHLFNGCRSMVQTPEITTSCPQLSQRDYLSL